MIDGRIAEITARQGGVISTAQLRECGLSASGIAHRVGTHRLVRVRRGVYALGPYVDGWGHRWAVVLAAGPTRAILSHWSAADIHGIAKYPGSRHHVTLPGTGHRRVAGLRIHRSRDLRPDDAVVVHGLRVTSPTRTVLDIAGAAGDATIRRMIREGEFLGLLHPGAMAATVAGRGGHPGVARVRRVDPGTQEAALDQTPLEDALEGILATLPLPPPSAQLSVEGVGGTRYRADFAWPSLRLLVEADGRTAHARASAFETDRARDADLAAVGWLTLRFTRIQVLTAGDETGDRIVETARIRGWRPGRVVSEG